MNHNAFLHAPCDWYGRYTGHRTVKHTERYTDMPAMVLISVRKIAHDDEPIMKELFPAKSPAENLQFLQIHVDSPTGIPLEPVKK